MRAGGGSRMVGVGEEAGGVELVGGDGGPVSEGLHEVGGGEDDAR